MNSCDKNTIREAIEFLEMHRHYDWYWSGLHRWVHDMPAEPRKILIESLYEHLSGQPRETDVALARYLLETKKAIENPHH